MRLLTRAFVCAVILYSVSSRAALTADNLLLIVNKNVPEGQKLADHYADARHVPAGRIVALDLPTGDNITVDAFDRDMVAPIRTFLTDNHLEKQVTCLVTFYGVPLRIEPRVSTPELRAELGIIWKQSEAAVAKTQQMVDSLEKLAAEVDPSFQPFQLGAQKSAEMIPKRADHAIQFIVQHLQQMPAGTRRDELEAKTKELTEQFRAPVNIPESATMLSIEPATKPSSITPEELNRRAGQLSMRRWDPAARRELRDLARNHGGILMFLKVIMGQEQYLDTQPDNEAAIDNELPLLWTGLYPRVRSQPNPLNYQFRLAQAAPIVMVSRLDGSKPEQVKAMIDTSLKVEREGLKGRIVLDSRGLSPEQPAGNDALMRAYDQTIRDLETLLRSRSKLLLLVDDRAGLIPANTVKDCAVYCGWYSPGEYVPSVAFVPGGVALHIASYEMLTLHNPTKGWCRNMLDAGAVATFGPCSEPTILAFPAADEFFSLLFTGKLTLAEVYWKTNPMISWKITLLGDPLYTPYKANPALQRENLKLRLRDLVIDSTTKPQDR